MQRVVQCNVAESEPKNILKSLLLFLVRMQITKQHPGATEKEREKMRHICHRFLSKECKTGSVARGDRPHGQLRLHRMLFLALYYRVCIEKRIEKSKEK